MNPESLTNARSRTTESVARVKRIFEEVDDQPRVSVIMPVRNAAGTLPTAMDSLLAQTFTRWELIVVDDGSSDATLQVLREYARRDLRIRVLSQAPLGIVPALQRACAEARGEFLARMDADDRMAPDRIERQTAHLDAHPELGVVSCAVEFGGDAEFQAGYAAHVEWINSLTSPEIIALRRFVESPVAHPSVMFRRLLWSSSGGYRAGDFPEDYELWLRWLDAGVRFGKVDASLLTWMDHPGRLSRTEGRYRTEAFYRIKCHYLARWLRQQIAPGRPIWLWGAGRVTRKRFRCLQEENVQLAGFIDINPAKAGKFSDGRPVLMPEELGRIRDAFIIAGVGVRGARDLIAAELARVHGIEGKDFLLAA